VTFSIVARAADGGALGVAVASKFLGVGAAVPGATFTGPACHAWAGGAAGDGFAIQGNMLAGPQVVEQIRKPGWPARRRTGWRTGCLTRCARETRPAVTGVGIANLEERIVAGRIDPLVLDQLRNA